MAHWSIVVCAAVSQDLEDAFNADLREARLAVGALEGGNVDLSVAVTAASVARVKEEYRLRLESVDRRLPADQLELVEIRDGAALRSHLLDHPTWNEEETQRMLVLWGHGERGLRTHKEFAVPGAEQVLEAFGEEAGDPPPPPDVIGYDACRMATAPTVLTLARVLTESIFIGSMIPEPASGWPYAELLNILATTEEPRAAAAAIVQSYAASVDVADWCLVALDLSKIGGPSGLSSALLKLSGIAPPASTEFYRLASGADTLDDTNLVDLGALMRRLTDRSLESDGGSALRGAAAEVRTAIRSATVARRASGDLAGRDGLSVQVNLPPTVPVQPYKPVQPARTTASSEQASSEQLWETYLEPGVFGG
jgi:hypothetical protein